MGVLGLLWVCGTGTALCVTARGSRAADVDAAVVLSSLLSTLFPV